MIGGAAINRDFGRRIGFLEEGARYFEPGVYYAKDAFEGLEIMDVLTAEKERRTPFVQRMREEAERARDATRVTPSPVAAGGRTARATLERADIPAPPFWGARVVDHVDPRELWPNFDLKSLYRLSWGGANAKGAVWDALVRDEFEPRLRAYQALAEREPILTPRAVYGYFPAAGSGDEIVVYDPQDRDRELARFAFPRQVGGEHLSLADYLHEPGDGAASDVIALQVVTIGRNATERTGALQLAGDYSESYYLHGFSVQSAEALAESMHHRVRAELNLPPNRGKRYSWGYGACPDLAQHEIVWRLLGAREAIGVELTEAYQIVPEQSTAAIIIHHPQASYFNAAAVRELASV
jgi:5-methyltetrahydrofolate--homocysteine methyltransferase